MYGDLSETASFSACNARESLLLPGGCYPTHPKTLGSCCSRGEPNGAEKGRRALHRRPLLATAGSRVRFRGTVGIKDGAPVMINPAYELLA